MSSTIGFDARRLLADVRVAATRLDVTFASETHVIEPATVEDLAQLGCRLIELAAILAEHDGED